MDSSSLSNSVVSGFKDEESMVDHFLVEALQNPRHRVTILRMELDIQRFLNNAEQQHFEFPHFPSSYLRLAAHRVAQHYGMQTMVQDNGLDCQGTRIMVRKIAESRFPMVRLSEIPAKQLEKGKPELIKIAIRPRPNKTSLNEANENGKKGNHLRSVEERKEEYERARARIFSSSRSCDSDDLSHTSTDEKNYLITNDENETSKNTLVDSEKCISGRDINSTRVAIFRDREKDRSDPDYDRSYGRYARSIPTSSPNLMPFNLQQVQPPFVQYDNAINQLSQMSQSQASPGYGPPSSPMINPLGVTGLNQASGDAAFLQWPSAAMMYAHSYDQFRHAVFQTYDSDWEFDFETTVSFDDDRDKEDNQAATSPSAPSRPPPSAPSEPPPLAPSNPPDPLQILFQGFFYLLFHLFQEVASRYLQMPKLDNLSQAALNKHKTSKSNSQFIMALAFSFGILFLLTLGYAKSGLAQSGKLLFTLVTLFTLQASVRDAVSSIEPTGPSSSFCDLFQVVGHTF
ncbi:hypothetical protein Fmac_025763 [Flemingia macrophylla]|uniref:R3H domain-containing protein 2 n=1 Tax=Flemingia macrophylla TaxID=520843 RepID=A0ABD1LV11_9FABA